MDFVMLGLLLGVNFILLVLAMYSKDIVITSFASFGFIFLGLITIVEGLV